MDKISVQIFHAPIYMNESRLLKTSGSLLKLKLVSKIYIIGYWINGLKEEDVEENITIYRIKTLLKRKTFRKGILRKFVALFSLIEYHIGTIKRCKKISPDYISCHNVQLLPLCAFIKFTTGCKLFYEPHELESEKTGITGFSKKIVKAIEKIFISTCDKVVTVCEPITQDYIKRYNIKEDNIFTIRNVPVNPSFGVPYKRSEILREKFQIPNGSLIYIYQGLIDRFRGLENYLKTFSTLGDKHHLVLMGYGEDVEMVKEYEIIYSNIHYQEAVPVSEIIKYTSSANVGLIVIPGNLSLSYRYSLPNKFYEYAIAGLFICVSDNLEYLKKIVTENGLGAVIGSKEEDLGKWICKNDVSDLEKVTPSRESILERSNYGWQNEEKVFCQLYK